jgi:hypothetical protein
LVRFVSRRFATFRDDGRLTTREAVATAGGTRQPLSSRAQPRLSRFDAAENASILRVR